MDRWMLGIPTFSPQALTSVQFDSIGLIKFDLIWVDSIQFLYVGGLGMEAWVQSTVLRLSKEENSQPLKIVLI